MSTQEKLLFTLDTLNKEREAIASSGWYLQHCWLVQVKPGGNARTNRKYWQVRSRKALFNGKKLKQLKPELVEDYKAAIARGRQLAQIDRQIEKLKLQLQQLAATTDSLNSITGTLPLDISTHAPKLQQPKDSLKTKQFTDLAEQEQLVREVLAKSQLLRNSLRQSMVRSKSLISKGMLFQEDFL